MFVQVESTPNPDTLKFLLGHEAGSTANGLEFSRGDDVQNSTLAQSLFEVEGVEKVFLGGDFVSVTKSGDIAWDILRPEVLVIITDYFALNKENEEPALQGAFDSEQEPQEFFDEQNLDIVNKIKELIENYVRPAVAQDGGDIKFRGYKDGVVFVKLRGACSGCPSATVTLKDGVYGMLSYYIPEVKAVESEI